MIIYLFLFFVKTPLYIILLHYYTIILRVGAMMAIA